MKIENGFSLIEVIVAATIISVFLGAMVGERNLYLRAQRTGPDKVKALYMAEEALENLKFLRDQSWTENIAAAVSTSTYIDKFLRDINIVDLDDHTKQVSVSVSWQDTFATSTVSLSATISNLYDN